MTNVLAYYNTATITAVKSFITQGRGLYGLKVLYQTYAITLSQKTIKIKTHTLVCLIAKLSIMILGIMTLTIMSQ